MGTVSTTHEYLTAEELAQLVRVPIATVYTWRYKGDGPPAARVGRHLRYRRDAVDEWLRTCEEPPGSTVPRRGAKTRQSGRCAPSRRSVIDRATG